MTESKNKATYSSNFYWHDPTNFIFVKYQAKEKKSVCLLSSMHDSTDVDTSNEKKKPEIILFYNANKVGVDCFDQMARLCTTRSASGRWLVAVWGNISDIAAINSYVLYKRVANNRITRRQFILMLVENLLDKPEPCLSNSNRQSEETMKECGSRESVMVYAATTRQSQLVFYVKNLLVKNVHKTISE